MKLIQPKVEIIPQKEGLLGIYKQIELAGRTCYKSEDKITDTSATEFVQRMITSGHTAMLEHGTVYLAIPMTTHYSGDANVYIDYPTFCRVNQSSGFKFHDIHGDAVDCWCITTNLRFIQEHDLWTDLEEFTGKPTEFHERRITARFTCDRGVSHELVRHRVFSFAQESSRYCNYSKGKFGGELTFITPSWWDNANESVKSLFLDSLSTAEDCYMEMLDNGCKPQEARQVLPNALKTEVVMTGFVSDWQHFFDLRCAPSAHPDMQVLAKDLQEKFKSL